MSSALALAAVTAVLKDLLNNGIIANDLAAVAGNSVRVTSKPPDLLKTGADEEAGLNLFLYHTAHNTTLRNNSLPAFDARGDRVSNPPLALSLHYLLMAYGKDEYQAEILMGYAMQLLHETPVLSRKAIQDSLSAIPSLQVSGSILPPAYQALAAADLADQIETVKISPEPLGVEDLSKLWSAFQANHFRLTAGYTASVVLIQSKKSTRASLPVLKSNLYVMPLKHPRIDEVVSAAVPPADVRITSASTILIKGSGLSGDVTRVQIGDGHGDPGERGRCADRDRSDHGRRPARRRAGHTGDPRPAHGRSGAGPAASRLRVERRAVRPASGDHGAGDCLARGGDAGGRFQSPGRQGAARHAVSLRARRSRHPAGARL